HRGPGDRPEPRERLEPAAPRARCRRSTAPDRRDGLDGAGGRTRRDRGHPARRRSTCHPPQRRRGGAPVRSQARLGRIGGGLALVALTAGLMPAGALAHGPDPLLGTRTWNANQVVGYAWASGAVPPSWMVPAIDAGAGDVGESKHSRAASFTRQSGAA